MKLLLSSRVKSVRLGMTVETAVAVIAVDAIGADEIEIVVAATVVVVTAVDVRVGARSLLRGLLVSPSRNRPGLRQCQGRRHLLQSN